MDRETWEYFPFKKLTVFCLKSGQYCFGQLKFACLLRVRPGKSLTHHTRCPSGSFERTLDITKVPLSGLHQLIRFLCASVFPSVIWGSSRLLPQCSIIPYIRKLPFRKALSYNQIGNTSCPSMYYQFSNHCDF